MTTTADLLAGTVMDAAAALLNDNAKTRYTYAVQIPYLNIASNDLKELFQLNDMPVTEETTEDADIIEVDAGVTEVGFAPTPPIVDTPYLPDDLIEPKILWQRQRGIDPWVPTTRSAVLPLYLAGAEINWVTNWVWESQKIKFLASNSDLDFKLNYIKNLFPVLEDEDSEINVVNAQSFLTYRTAALMAKYIDEDPERSNDLNSEAGNAIDRALGISTKGRQSIVTRRRPFRASFKRRRYI